MKIEIECPHCSRRYSVGPQNAGKQVRCKACQKTFLIPTVASEPEPAVPMAELILEPIPALKPAPPQPAPVAPAAPWHPAPLEPVQPFHPARGRKLSRSKQGYRPTVLEQIASGLLIASFAGNMLQGPPNGPLTWAFQASIVGTGMVLWVVAMVRRRSQVGIVVVCGASVIAMGLLVYQLAMLGSRKEPLKAERPNIQNEADEFRSAFPQWESDDSHLPPKIRDRRRTPPAQAAGSAQAERNRAVSRGKDTELVGGTGGSPFRSVSPDGELVVGIACGLGSWDGEAALSQIEPLFDRDEGRGKRNATIAREGYGLGALEVETIRYVNAVRPVFMRIKPDGQLDPADSYSGEWIGTPTGRATRTLGDGRSKVIGICGRGAAVLDAVGLVTER